MPPNIGATIIAYGQQRKNDELKELIEGIQPKQLVNLVQSKIAELDGYTLWHFTLIGLGHSAKCADKRFTLVMAVLNHLNAVELPPKIVFDIVTRLLTDLPSMTAEHLVEIAELCMESIRAGDPNCLCWKDLLPHVLQHLTDYVGRFNANGMLLTGKDYRQKLLADLFKMRLQLAVMTPLCSMFREISLNREEAAALITKVADSIKQMIPLEVPPLSVQLFHLCLKHSSLLVIPIYALQRYFHKNYYKKVLSNANSDTTDFDSIDPFSDSEIREAEETILYHLSNVTEFRVDETQVVAMFKPYQNNPEFLFTPFMIGALVAMSRINRLPDTANVIASPIMAFLLKLVLINEQELEMCQQSAWCRDRIEQSTVARVEQVFGILTENSQEGREVVTPGIIHFAFALLLSKKQPKLHRIAIIFFQNFIKRRFIFGKGIVAKLKKFLFAELDEPQFTECLVTLSLTSGLTFSECTETVQFIMDYFLLINGTHAMRFMAFIYPLIRVSHKIRDSFIEILRKSMYNGEMNTRMMGVFGFCSLLKQLKNSNSRRTILGTAGGSFTQITISGMSLLSQAAFGRANNPNIHFDMLTLEILGILRKCFTQTVEIREMLYEGLGRAVEFNTMLLPHVLQFIDWHFESYFGENPEDDFTIDFEKCVRYKMSAEDDFSEHRQVVVYDSIGRLTALMVHCVVLCDQHEIEHDNTAVKKTLQLCSERIQNITLDSLGIVGTLDAKTSVLANQYLNVVEAGMAYCAWNAKSTNNCMVELVKLYKHHQHCSEKIKKMEPKKSGKKGADMTVNSSVQSGPKSIQFKPDNVWDLSTIVRLLKVLFDPARIHANDEDSLTVHSNRDFQQFVLKVAAQKLEGLRSLPDYWQVKHSKRIFGHLCECSKLVYDRCVSKTTELFGNGGLLVAQAAVDCFRQALLSASALYERKMGEFLQLTGSGFGGSHKMELLKKLQTIVEEYFGDGSEPEPISEKIIVNLLHCLELLYKLPTMEEEHRMQAYNWLQNFCITTKLKTKALAIVHRILFDMRLRTQTGAYFETVAMQIERKFGQIAEEELSLQFALKSISSVTVEATFLYLCNVVKQQIDDLEHLILRTNSLLSRLKTFFFGENAEHAQTLNSLERSICSQLVNLLQVLTHLCNTQLPLGTPMDSLLKVLLALYACLTNLTRHFTVRHSIIALSYETTKFNLVVKSSKPLASKIYDLIPFIEENILGQDASDEPTTSLKAKADRDKVLRQTKLIPKLVFRIETFNKVVLQLSKKTKKDLTYLLHLGTVRDFRIKTSALVEAIQKTVSDNLDRLPEDDDEPLVEPEEKDNDDDEQLKTSASLSSISSSRSVAADESQVIEQVENMNVTKANAAQALKNLAMLNERTRKKARKRKNENNAEVSLDVSESKREKRTQRKVTSPKGGKKAVEKATETVAPVVAAKSRTLGLNRRSLRKT